MKPPHVKTQRAQCGSTLARSPLSAAQASLPRGAYIGVCKPLMPPGLPQHVIKSPSINFCAGSQKIRRRGRAAICQPTPVAASSRTHQPGGEGGGASVS